MKVIVDTNVLLRAALNDDAAQRKIAIDILDRADLVAVSAQSLCEFAWVLDRTYKTARTDIAAAIRRLLDMRNVALNRPVIEAGLQTLGAGGDFADGVIAHDGKWLGGETFVSFDRKAVALLRRQGIEARLLVRD